MPYLMIKDLTMLTNDIVNFEQIDPGYGVARKLSYRILSNYHTYPYKSHKHHQVSPSLLFL